jgi:hypothetical protein
MVLLAYPPNSGRAVASIEVFISRVLLMSERLVPDMSVFCRITLGRQPFPVFSLMIGRRVTQTRQLRTVYLHLVCHFYSYFTGFILTLLILFPLPLWAFPSCYCPLVFRRSVLFFLGLVLFVLYLWAIRVRWLGFIQSWDGRI